MTHINGPVIWSFGELAEVTHTDLKIKIKLEDGSVRVMNYKSWGADAVETERKASSIPVGAKIRFATWNGWDSKIWFCDIEEIR